MKKKKLQRDSTLTRKELQQELLLAETYTRRCRRARDSLVPYQENITAKVTAGNLNLPIHELQYNQEIRSQQAAGRAAAALAEALTRECELRSQLAEIQEE